MTITVVDLQYLVMLLAMIGTVFNARMSVMGFYIWIFADVIAVFMFSSIGLFGMAALYTAYVALCVYGIYYWGKK